MTNREIEFRLKQAVENCTPDVLDRVMSDCDRQKGDVIVMTTRKNNHFIKKFVSVAAALIIVIGAAGFGYNYYNTANNVASIVSFDVNPSIELELNKKANVIEANALNADAQKVLGGLELKGTDANTATSAIIGSLLQNGYIDEIANSILISVEDKDDARGAKLQEQLTQQIAQTLDGASANAAVMAQHMSGEGIDTVAEEYNISHGKAALIERIIAVNPTYTEKDLAALSVNELNLIISNPKNAVDEVVTSGTASDKEYIGADKAKTAALNHAGVKAADAYDFEIDFDYENGKMIYEVDFDVKGKEYEIDVDALTGEIVKTRNIAHNSAPQAEQTTAASAKPESTTVAANNDIGKAKAQQLALDKAGAKESDVTNLKVTSDYDDGRLEYNVKFIYKNRSYEYEINAANGKITEIDIDGKYDDDFYEDNKDHAPTKAPSTAKPESNAVNVDDIGSAKAKQIALNNAGAKEANVSRLRVEREYDDGRLEYNVEFNYNGKEYEYEINGSTGAITDYDIERIDFDD